MKAVSSAHSHPQLLNSTQNPFSIEACLHSFCLPEVLEGEDKIYCQECTDRLQNSSEISTEHSPNLEGSFSDNKCSKLDRTSETVVGGDLTSHSCEKCDSCESGDTECNCECEKRDPCDREGINSRDDVKHKYGEEMPKKSNDIVESRTHSESSSHKLESLVRDSEDLCHSPGLEKDDDSGVNDLEGELYSCQCACMCVCLLFVARKSRKLNYIVQGCVASSFHI